MALLRKLVLLLCLLSLAGCGFVGVETLAPIKVEKKAIYTYEVMPTKYSQNPIKIGAPVAAVVSLLGEPSNSSTDGTTVVFTYPSRNPVRSGVVICIVLIPLPFRSETIGEFKLYFEQGVLMRIVSAETKAGFYGVYADDSGAGVVMGDKSKCNI